VNWEAIGAVAELLGALGVIITLIYLAAQIRHSSALIDRSIEASRIAAEDGIVRSFNDWRALLVADESVSDIYFRGLTDIRSLSVQERMRFNHFMNTFLWTGWQNWRSQELVGETNVELFRHMLRYEGGREFYRNNREFFPPDFRDALDDLLQEIKDGGLGEIPPEQPSSMFAGPLKVE
jgi:hypothetical protein